MPISPRWGWCFNTKSGALRKRPHPLNVSGLPLSSSAVLRFATNELAEALAGGFRREESAVAAGSDATATQASGNDAATDEAGREEKGGEFVGE